MKPDCEATDDKTQEIAEILRASEEMAAAFADRVQERVGQPISHGQILAIMKHISSKRLTMDLVVTKLRRQL